MGRVIVNLGKLPGNYQVIPGNYSELPITRVCRGRSSLVIRNQGAEASETGAGQTWLCNTGVAYCSGFCVLSPWRS